MKDFDEVWSGLGQSWGGSGRRLGGSPTKPVHPATAMAPNHQAAR